MDELQTYYQIPSITHFCNLFRHHLDLPDFDYEDLEFAFVTLISSDESDVSSVNSNLVLRLICSLLKGYFRTTINDTNWENYLQKLFQIQWTGIEKKSSPFITFDLDGNEIHQRFYDLPLRVKLDVIHALCDYRLFADDIANIVNEINGDDYRVEPLGTDSKGYIYWYFYGTRLYRENPGLAEKIDSSYKKYDESLAKRAEDLKRVKLKEEQERKRQELEEIKRKKEETKKSRNLPPKVPGFREGLRQRKPETPSKPNGVVNNKNSSKKSAVSVESTNKKCEISVTRVKDVLWDLSERQEGWSLVCRTEQDWKELCEKFAKSKTKCEIEFYRLLSKSFVPKITEIFEEQEKERAKVDRQRLLELLPRRASSRIELKKIVKEKQDLEEEELERRLKDELERKRRLDNEKSLRERSERIRQEREERASKRIKLVEERADRAIKRQLIENGVIHEMNDIQNTEDFNDSNDMNTEYINEEFTNILSPTTNTIDKLHENLEKVIVNVKSNRDAWPFAEPVDGIKFPMYYQVIEHPIDLSIIENKILNKEYNVFEDLEKDFKLMVNNCETFNGPKNGYTLMAYAVWRAFKRATLKHLERELSYDESIAFIYPPKKSNPSNIKPAIEAKKKKIQNKRRTTFKALNVLAEAAEKAVMANESRLNPNTVINNTTDNEESCPKTISFSNPNNVFIESHEPTNTLQVDGDMWANFLHNINHKQSIPQLQSNPQQTVSTNTKIAENLTFKSLNDWSQSIKQNGNCVVLPQNAVIISSPKVSQVGPQFSLKVVSSGNDMNTNTSNAVFTSSVISNNENARKELSITDPKRLVIKLSRCETGQVWKPVTIISTTQNSINPNNMVNTVNFTNTGQVVSNNVQLIQSLRSIPSNCIPVKKRLLPVFQANTQNQLVEQTTPSLTITNNTSNTNTFKPISQSFQISGIQSNQSSNVKIYRLQTVDQSTNNLLIRQNTNIPTVLMPSNNPTPNGLNTDLKGTQNSQDC
ncbi:chromatin remodeling regulator CECR2-like [Oppia nitens]|uniref:chromatin remodeling regulator CECR2-like n=1 Tax=Oppia nitens TaxID=1686743 RepID=UPI0023DAF78A|nr:chromatin remodeling regulator CECR2-like [Oppia nitens]